MLVEYYVHMIALNPPEIAAQLDADAMATTFWDEVGEYMPPDGCMALAHDTAGALLGGGMMRTIRPSVAEFKRLFVRPQARGLGLGRKLIQVRLDAARNMGFKTILADTLRKTTAMQALYANLGFQPIDRYPESHSAVHFPALASELLYFQLDL
jgi:GNAT superfamily N-acetyltransferase